jgi:soluble lytic murein transglycosylase-like protein
VSLRAVTLALVLGSLFGCSQDGFLPGGAHALPSGQLQSLVSRAAHEYGVRPQLVYAVIDAESKRDPAAISRAGAMGLMQLMPATSAEYGVVNPFDPQANVAGGVHYLRDLLARYHGNVDDALAAYNAGPGVVDADHGVPAYPETRSYVARVTAELH